jgi:hypothetical protein
MVQSKAQTVTQYLADIPPDRRRAIAAVRKVVLDNLPAGYAETMQYGMISYVVPLERFPETYNGQALAIASLGSQKNYMALYLMCVYGHKETQKWFVKKWKASGKKLDMGKSCVRFKKLDDLVLPLIGKVIAGVSVDQFLAFYEKSRKKGR